MLRRYNAFPKIVKKQPLASVRTGNNISWSVVFPGVSNSSEKNSVQKPQRIPKIATKAASTLRA